MIKIGFANFNSSISSTQSKQVRNLEYESKPYEMASNAVDVLLKAPSNDGTPDSSPKSLLRSPQTSCFPVPDHPRSPQTSRSPVQDHPRNPQFSSGEVSFNSEDSIDLKDTYPRLLEHYSRLRKQNNESEAMPSTELTHEKSALAEKLTESSKQTNNNHERRDELKGPRIELQKNLEHSNDEIASAVEKKAKLEQEIKVLDAERQQQRKEIEAQRIELEKKLNNILNEVAAKKQGMKAFEANKQKQCNEIEAALKQQIEHVELVEKTIKYYEHLLAMAEVMLEALFAESGENTQQRINALKAKLAAVQDRLDELNRVNGKAAKAEKLKRRIAILKIDLEISEAREQARIREITAGELAAVQDRIVDLKEPVVEKRQEIATLTFELKNLGVEDPEREVIKPHDWYAILKLQTQYKRVKADLADLQKELLTKYKEKKELEQQVKSLEADRLEKSEKNTAAETEIVRLEKQPADLQMLYANGPLMFYSLRIYIEGLFEKKNIALQKAMLKREIARPKIALAGKVARLQSRIGARVEEVLQEKVNLFQTLVAQLKNCLDEAQKESQDFERSLLKLNSDRYGITQRRSDIYFKHKRKISFVEDKIKAFPAIYHSMEEIMLKDIRQGLEKLKVLENTYPEIPKTSNDYEKELGALRVDQQRLLIDSYLLHERAEKWRKRYDTETVIPDVQPSTAPRIQRRYSQVGARM